MFCTQGISCNRSPQSSTLLFLTFFIFLTSMDKRNVGEREISFENNLQSPDRGMKIEVWREVSHSPLSSVWSPLKQHLSDDNLEKILLLSFDMLLRQDLDTGYWAFSPTCTTQPLLFNLSSCIVCKTEDGEQVCKFWIAIDWALHKRWTETKGPKWFNKQEW